MGERSLKSLGAKRISNVAIVMFLIGMLFAGYVGYKLGYSMERTDGNIFTGSPAYFCIENIGERIKKGDPDLSEDIEELLKNMDRKNSDGSNGPAMGDYNKKQKIFVTPTPKPK